MKNILGDGLGDIMSADNTDIRNDKMQEFVLSEMGKFIGAKFLDKKRHFLNYFLTILDSLDTYILLNNFRP